MRARDLASLCAVLFLALLFTFLALLPLRAFAQAACPSGWIRLDNGVEFVAPPGGAQFEDWRRSSCSDPVALFDAGTWGAGFTITVGQYCHDGSSWVEDSGAFVCALPVDAPAPEPGALAYGSEAVGAWLVTLGSVMCLGLGFIAGKLR